jgi:hypothetical protein
MTLFWCPNKHRAVYLLFLSIVLLFLLRGNKFISFPLLLFSLYLLQQYRTTHTNKLLTSKYLTLIYVLLGLYVTYLGYIKHLESKEFNYEDPHIKYLCIGPVIVLIGIVDFFKC